MSNYSFYLVMTALVVILMLALAPTRAIVTYIFGDKGFLQPLFAAIAGVIRAHVTVARNFAPRSIIYPTLEPTQRTNQED